MRRTRADILADIEHFTKRLNKHPEWVGNYTLLAKLKKHYTNKKNEAKKELKKFDEANK